MRPSGSIVFFAGSAELAKKLAFSGLEPLLEKAYQKPGRVHGRVDELSQLKRSPLVGEK